MQRPRLWSDDEFKTVRKSLDGIIAIYTLSGGIWLAFFEPKERKRKL
jgi:hypothetical protein